MKIKQIVTAVRETIELGDSFDIELGNMLIQTGVVGFTRDGGVVVEADNKTLALLGLSGALFESVDSQVIVENSLDDAYELIQNLVRSKNNQQFFQIKDAPQGPIEKYVSDLLNEKYSEVANDNELNLERHRDAIAELVKNELADDVLDTDDDSYDPTRSYDDSNRTINETVEESADSKKLVKGGSGTESDPYTAHTWVDIRDFGDHMHHLAKKSGKPVHYKFNNDHYKATPESKGFTIKSGTGEIIKEGYWRDALKRTMAARAARTGNPFEKNPLSHDKSGIYKGDKDLAGNPVPKKKQGVAEGADVEYVVVIRDEQGKRSIRVSALTPTDAKEKAEAQGYKVLKVKDPREANYFREQGVAEGLNEMDKSAPQPGRDGKVSHSTYGSRDKKGSDYFKGKEAPGKPVTKKQMEKYALDILKKQGMAEGKPDQLPTRGADYSQYDTDHLRTLLKPGILHRNEARFKALIRKELQKREQQVVSKGSLNEFASSGGDDGGDDGFSEETLKMLAAQWYNGNEDPQVERTLMAAGWEIGQDEGYDDTPGVFVVQIGDSDGNSYLSWPAHELKKGVAEGSKKAWMKHNNLVDLEKPSQGLENELDNLLRTHDPEERKKYQHGVKQRIKTQPMSGPKAQLPEQDVAEAKADPTSTWVVYDRDKVKRFKTHNGAKAYAQQHGGKVASSAYYADKIQGKQGVTEAEYQGRQVPLGKPMAGDVAKSKVYVKGPKGNVVKVNFGDKNMRIKKSNPKRRKSFRARHNCDNPGPRWKARYWSCRAW